MSVNSKKPLIQVDIQYRHAYSSKIPLKTIFKKPSLTKQSFRDECDINTIMAKYQKSGILPDVFNPIQPQYLDVSGSDFQEAMQLVAEAQTMFNDLPSSLRARFKNDPAEFLAFTSDEKNRSEMAEMGLLKPIAAQSISSLQPAASAASSASNEADKK